ncbi:CRISPR-associated endonuclease Cas2 [Synechococcales cyanobacterium C]|uniref:CRISPR-associated endoribonuclease Cas2 n=1 Tax=Petrachloros mirabilis ULC683 TaxID=2781853 RepID=A0A8K2A6N6_9CYAN|nr:CRISPR-associated endonuclease Cas2 [Petrachloros mirabilis]NCJ06051.1 CRISPR-associated endonuclease Cas2 [Petrachloros mirabilis ULC683]
MDVLVAYDVNTETKAGKRRLRKVATVCKNFGQRVQFSVFECRVSQAQYETLRAQLVGIIDTKTDNLRFYRLPSPREQYFEQFGVDHYTDFDEPLIL